MAPFRGFLQDRAALAEQSVPLGDCLFFFGCRDPQVDFLYADELRGHAEAGVVELHAAFSRRPVEGRTYVQHLIDRERDRVWQLLEDGAAVYVCGNANTMAPGVRAALTDIHRERTGGSEDAAQQWLAGLRADDRLLEDIWGEQAVGL